ncbi:class I adenylate-forming enzyme family protein [Nocardia macrotermitis]|uniref:3-[(3aS,4S,7aS)-7a-methyl-1, 5-dioxo-octahydro-1H-inden-4-yl]propanoyl:CoA ligase n=1 Tax=Nocardia macrotermitis TaxID=2585198 RepID=A0A7K0D0J8_9NOCA|nr:class I adenylate-forming enzyme family protein [Nocardia macrotermitis]MQY18752.1 3-[(3aS,4S,7aS)-7a-methyl-1,5-dioxo-octahydro-1H-inden-4-yl]propanoyl:CoA ligase [Nocardia macrotermitis]
MDTTAAQDISIVSGPPLDSEPGLGALTLPGFLREVTELYGDREALTAHGDDGVVVRWSYTELWERAMAVARALRACGIGRDGRVGVLMTNRPEWLAAVFGASLAGGVAVPLSTFSTAAELDQLLRLSGVSVLLFERRVLSKDFAEILAELEPALGQAGLGPLRSVRYPFLRRLAMVGPALPTAAIDTWDTFLARGRTEARELIEATAAATRPSDTGVLFFSSGSTSAPKGVLSAHRGVTIQMWRFRRLFGFGPQDDVRAWVANGFFWSGNFAQALGSTLAAGGSLVLQPIFDAPQALELMQAERVNFPGAWPHQWAQLEAAPNWGTVDLSAMRFVDYHTPIAHHPTVSTVWYEPGRAYGNTETFTITTCYPADTPDEVHAGSSGVALPGVTVKVVDPITDAVTARGESGEICVKGPTLMLGYLGMPLSETLDADGYFHTGDGGYLDATGRLYWKGRLTDIIKTGGANVSPLEVDEALIGYPGVKVARTVGVPHDTLGEMVVACLVPHEGTPPDPDALRTHLRERLASYKIPRHILFFDESDIALTGSAKIKSSDLRELAARRLSQSVRGDLQ